MMLSVGTFVVAWIVLLIGGQGNVPVSGEDVLKYVEENLSDVKDYAVDLDVTADVDRMNVPPMHVRMYYKQPDKFHFDSEGFALLPREGLVFSAAKILSRFSVEGVEQDSSGQERLFRISLSPKDRRARILELVVYIDAKQWRPRTIASSFADGRTMTASFEYELQGMFFMPSLLVVKFTASPADTSEQSSPEPAPLQRPAMPRNGTITVRYSHYSINAGLSDDIFEEK